MRQTLRQIVAVLALVAIAMNLVPSALAATYTDVSAANKLAEAGIINDFSANVAGYRLGDNLLRQEGIGVAGKASGIIPDAPVSDYDCQNKFSDISEAWVCRAAELAAKAGITNAANTTFRPKDNLTRYEAMLFAFRSSCTDVESPTTSGVAEQAAEAGIISNAATFNANAAATRGEFFRYVAASLDENECSEEDDNILCVLDPSFCDEEDDEDPTVPSNGGDIEVELSNDSPEGRSLPKGASGVHVASFEFTAKDDAVVTSVELTREGLSVDADTEGFALTVDGKRITDSKDENSDDVVNLTIKNGGLELMKGKTVTVDVIMDTPALGATTGAEIAVSLTGVTANGDVSGLPVEGETFEIASVTAPALEVKADGSVSDPQLGQKGADLFRFKLENDSSNDDITIHSITFEQTGSIDTEDLENFELVRGSTVLATVESTSDDFVAFVLEDPLTITEGNNVAFRVKADVVGGAAETIIFEIANKLDVMASSDRYGSGTAVTLTASVFSTITVEAGMIALTEDDAPSDKVREDKDDVVLGKFTITAASDGLEIKDIGFVITTVSTASSTVSGSCVSGFDDASCFLENVQIRNVDTGARYDLNTSGTLADAARTYYDTAFDYTLDEGENEFEIIADTVNNITNFNNVDLTLSLSADDSTVTDADGGIVIEETADDEAVTDITPSSLTWKKVEGSESGATVSTLPLSDIKQVRGSQNVIAMQFEIDADESSDITIDEIKATINQSGDLDGDSILNGVDPDTDGDGTANGADTDDDNDGILDVSDTSVTGATAAGVATSQMIAQAALYKGTTVTSENLLDTVSGSQLSSGVATFDNFESTIASDDTQVYTITLTFVDGVDAVNNGRYSVSLVSTLLASAFSAVDDDNDDITISTTTVTSARDITVNNAGVLTLTADGNNDDNEDLKLVLGGTTKKEFSVDILAQNEAVDIEEVVFTYTSATGDLSTAGATAELWLGTTKVGTATSSDVTATTITFDNLTTLVVPQGSGELILAISAPTIGYEKVGTVVKTVDITNVATNDATGDSSGKDVADVSTNVATSSAAFSIVPALVTPSVVTSLSSSSTQAKIKLTADVGANTLTASNSTPTVSVDSLTFSKPGAVGVVAADYVLYEEGNSAVQVIGKASGSNIVFDFADLNGDGTANDPFVNSDFTSSKTYVIVPTIAAGETASLTLLESGIQYDVDGVTNATDIVSALPNELDFGSRTINN